MDPRAMEIAMEQMKRMSPQQMQAMMQSMSSMSPDMMRMAQQQMGNMSSADWDRARQEMGSMDPSRISAQAEAARKQMEAQEEYTFTASTGLKAEGNKLHAAGRYEAAAEKYERARANMQGKTKKEHQDLAKACTLNLSSCYLNMGRYRDCIDECNAVLSGETEDLKALYRRGQAHAALNLHQQAAADLRRSLQLSGHDPAQQQLIREKLAAAEAKQAAAGAPEAGARSSSNSRGAEEDGLVEDVPGPASQAAQPTSSSSNNNRCVIMEEVEETTGPTASSSSGVNNNSSSSSRAPASSSIPGDFPGLPGMDPQQMQAAMDMMKNNPSLMSQAMSMMKDMPDEQFAAMMAAAPGASAVDPAAIKAMKQQMGSMSPEQLELMTKMAAAAAPGSSSSGSAATGRPTGPSSSSTGTPAGASMPGLDPRQAQMAAEMLRNNPDGLKEVMSMVKDMPDEQLSAMLASVPGAPAADPAAIKAMKQQMGSMTPEQLELMTKVAAAGGPAALNNPGAAAEMMKQNPAWVKLASDAMKQMSPEDFTRMMGQAGVPGGADVSPDMAKVAFETFSKMSPQELEQMAEMTAKMGMPGGGAAGGAEPPGVSGASSSSSNAGQALAGGSAVGSSAAPLPFSPAAALAGAGGAGAGGGLPGGPPGMPAMTPEMMKMATDMMKNMKPEDMAGMMQMMQGAGGPPSAEAGPAGLMSKISPQVMAGLITSMQGMDAESITSMIMSSGLCQSREQAEGMALKFKQLNPKHLELLGKLVALVTAVAQKLILWKQQLMQQPLLLLGLGLLLLAIVLRLFGIM